jgi:hypothetical protein
MSEATSDPRIDARIVRLRKLIAMAAAETVDMPNPTAWLRISMTLATEPSIAGTVQYELRPYAWQVRKALKHHLAKNPGLPHARLHCAAAEIAATVL